MELRQANESDIGAIAAYIMAWHRELPDEVKFFDGSAAQAERTAHTLVMSGQYLTRVVEGDDGILGGYSLGVFQGIFNDKPYGQLLCWYVKPKARGHAMLGLKMLLDAISEAEKFKLDRLEANPWHGDRGTIKVLSRLGFVPSCLTHMRKV